MTVLLIWIVSGCGSKSAKLPAYMRPELLYLKERPYSRLYVEVDTVEGVEVPEKWLDTLKGFLSTHCSKPDGIEIIRDEPVPFDDIKDMPIGPASILCMDGPDPNSGPQPAYLHVFFYAKDKIFKKTKENPYVYSLCPSNIFYNVDYGYRLDKMIKLTLPHEAGHLLGLCKNTTHGDGAHCTNKKCLMRPGPDSLPSLGLLLFGLPLKSDLCDNCLSDLEAYKSESPDPNLTFDGPFLIRREGKYSVASVPYFNILFPSFLDKNFDWQKILSFQKESIRKTDFGQYWKKKGMFSCNGLYIPESKDGSNSDMNLCMDILTKATKDPNPEIRDFAAQKLNKLKQEQGN